MRALGVRPCRVTRALALMHLAYGASASAADPVPPPAAPAAGVQPAAPSSPAPVVAPAAAQAPAPPAVAPQSPAPAPFSAPPESNPYPGYQPQESNPYPSYQPAPGSYPPGYYQPYPQQVQVEPLPPGSVAPRPAQQPKAARTGFQLGLRTGLSVPTGDATGAGNDSLSGRYSWQFPLLADLGWKVTEAVFLGGYVGVAFGGMGNDSLTSRYCQDPNYDYQDEIDCSAFSFQVGAQAIYSLDPGARWNPWIGYGIGYESTRQSIVHQRRNYSEANTASGLTAAKLMLGADYRGTIGIGPYAEASIGRYLRTETELNDRTVNSSSISDQSFHAWLTFGVRLVVMP